MVLAEEFSDWEDSHRRIDLVCLDKDADLVVVELKRTEDGGHMELQALRYAAMVSAMTFEQAVRAHEAYLRAEGREEDATASILGFLDWPEADDEAFAQNVRIILASAEFSRELTTAVMWLNERELDIRCVRMRPYRLGERLLVDVQQIIPLPEAADYQVRIQEKARTERASKKSKRQWDRESFLTEIAGRHTVEVAETAEDILDWAERLADDIAWGQGVWNGRASAIVHSAGHHYQCFNIYVDGGLMSLFDTLSKQGPFVDESLRREWRDRLNEIPGVELPEDCLDRRPRFAIRRLQNPDAMAAFKEAYGWVIETIRAFDRDAG